MDDQCTQTYEALEEFIQTQKTLLARTQSDIQRLRQLRNEVIDDPGDFIAHMSERLDDPAFRLSDQTDCVLSFPKKINWDVFEGRDLTPLLNLGIRLRQANARRNEPSRKQTSPLSELQKLVKDARRTIVDPILAQYANFSESGPESEEDIDPEVLRKQREHKKIRDLKKRQIRTCGLKLPSRSMASNGVFIRHDVEDESMEVDISSPHDEHDILVDDDSVIGSVSPDSRSPMPKIALSPIDIKFSAAPRARRPSKKAQSILNSTSKNAPTRPPKKIKVEAEVKSTPKSDVVPTRESSKPKPETYKQVWSVSEQHLLEQLLEDIPEGEKFRWQKISKAMNGRRTPRQVASRVQKYFEKLKRFGVGLDDS